MNALAMDLIVKATGIAAVGFIVAASMRRASAASRHLLWTAVFVALVLLPLARLTLPAVNLAVLAPTAPTAPVITRAAAFAEPDPGPAPFGAASLDQPAPTPIEGGHESTAVSSTWTPERLLMLLWIAGAGLVWLRAIIGVVLTRRLGRRARAATEPDLVGRLEHARLALRVRRPIRLLISTAESMPVTWGVVCPTVLLPSAALAWRRTCPDRIDAVLAHEVAHVARWDVLPKFVARVGVIMFWFHPLMWIAHRQACLERERACDDAVLALGSRPSDYAGHLVDVIRSLGAPAGRPDALAMAQSSQIERRVRAILDARVNRRRVTRASVVMAAVFVAATLPMASAQLTARALPAEVPTLVPVDVAASPELPKQPATIRPAIRGSARRPASVLQTPPPVPAASSQTAAAWQAERVAMLQQLLDRAKRHYSDSLIKVRIGTMAAVDTATAETTVATIEQALLAEQKRVVGSGAPAPLDAEVAEVRRRVAQALRNLDAAEVRADNGLITSRELSAAVIAVADAIRVPTTARSSAQALYELLTGRVSSTSGTGQTGQAGQDVKSLQKQAEDLAVQQRDVAAQVRGLGPAGQERDLRVQQLLQTKDAMRGTVAGIEQQLDRLGRAAQAANDEDAARRLQAAAGLVRDTMIKEKIEYSKQSMTAGSDYSRPIENEIAFNLDALRQRISEAAQAADRGRQPPLSDAALVTALKNAATIGSGPDRANTLIALASRHVFTPEMVSLYVAAASGIASEADRARAFAQPIRVKPPGR